MKLISLLSVALFASSALATDAVYTCADKRGDSFIIKVTREGQRIALRSRDARLNLSQKKHRATDPSLPDYVTFYGRYPSGYGYADAVVPVQASLVRGDSGAEVVGAVKIENFQYDCKVGEGELKVSKETEAEFSPKQRKEPCKLTSYYGGMTFMPPKIVCDYGNGMILMRNSGGIL